NAILPASFSLLSHSVYLIACFASSGKLFPIDRHWHLFITLACGLLWCPVLLLLNEAINWKDRVITHAEDRFAKLFFDTKLGMYSPV
uniref:Cation_ATPase_C domain-containing protein n=1 Tax=Mesocestoides corti TaxID=53468 RepID=A0A5K3FD19_MESCO